MRDMTKMQMPDGAIVRTLVTAIVMTGWMIVTGCAYLQHPNPPLKQVSACIDQGRSGYLCPDSSSQMAASISDQRAAAQNDLFQLHEEQERVAAKLAIANQQLKERDRLVDELSSVKHQIIQLEEKLEQMGQRHNN